MTRTIKEGFLRFHFDESWIVIKYDDHKDYRERIGRLPDIKAVDFAAIHDVVFLFFIEVKDFRGYRIQNRHRILDGELAVEVAQKVRDSVAGIVNCSCTSSWKHQSMGSVYRLSNKLGESRTCSSLARG